MLASAGLLVFVLSLMLTTGGRTIAQITSECIRICDEVPVRVALANVARIVGDVRITNDGDSPIPTRVNGAIQVDSSARNALRTKSGLQVTDIFQREVTITLAPGDSNEKVSFHVPQSRLLVIEGASGFAQMGPGAQAPQVIFKTMANGDPGVHLVFANPGAGGWTLSAPGWGPVLAYADPASTVEVTFARAGTTIGTATMTLTFTGHFIDQ
ncbi:MAG: hypothetical protein ND866_16365 [Pyrinomonadaceae bacterium]|nr:hypothetical protein [Pyrinomonadaceae bacterium]